MSDVAVFVPTAEAVEPAPRTRAARSIPMPGGQALAVGITGFLAAGLASGLGASSPEEALRMAPAGLVVAVGAVVLTGPALVVGHQYLGLSARPVALGAGLAEAFVRGGRTALGLAPALLFFSLTTGLWVAFAALAALVVSGIALGSAAVSLRDAEPGSMRMDGLLVGWSVLTALVAIRLAVHVALLVLG